MRGTKREGSYTGKSESYIRQFKEGFENGTSLSLQKSMGGTWREDFSTAGTQKGI